MDLVFDVKQKTLSLGEIQWLTGSFPATSFLQVFYNVPLVPLLYYKYLHVGGERHLFLPKSIELDVRPLSNPTIEYLKRHRSDFSSNYIRFDTFLTIQ